MIKNATGVLLVMMAIGFLGLSVVTALPVSYLPWNLEQECMLGYVSGCTFAPVSTLILLISATISLYASWRLIRRPF